MKSSIFICQLSNENQNKIREVVKSFLIKEGYNNKQTNEILSNVMDDRLCNIEEIVDIQQFLIENK
ncbi:hypothetical protein FDB50_15595 [Clostridium botulinum]|uniref:Uncharacterized protein n=1 Tax=Clostridium botulinum TaxID=1491 RepID=A0A846JTX5_CLOBO|nr:hypothetical protein [Clostridium botulinum]NFN36464.1 hypothetical protein [Clostridium botulinum]